MTKIYFEEMMAGFGCQGADGAAWGILRPKGAQAAAFPEGIPFSATLEDPRGPVVALQFALQGDARAILAPLRALGLSYQRYHLAAEGDISLLTAELKPASDFYLRSGIHSLLAALPGILAGGGAKPAAAEELPADGAAPAEDPAGPTSGRPEALRGAPAQPPAITPPTTCPLCGLGGCDCAALLAGAYRPAHAACLDTRLDLPEQDLTEPPTTKGHLLPGILGALLGALVGAVLIWSLMLTQERVYSVLYAFLPLLSALLYRVFRGKASLPVAALSVLGASLLAALLLEQVWYWLAVTHQLGHNVPLASTVQSYFSSFTFFSALKAMWLALLFMMAGYLASGILLRRYAAAGSLPGRTVRGAAFVRATALPLRPPPAGAPDKATDNRPEGE